MANYNGHPSYAAWNVSLWISNDEGLYGLAKDAMRRGKTKNKSAELLYESLAGDETPDGVKYTKTNLRHALKGLA